MSQEVLEKIERDIVHLTAEEQIKLAAKVLEKLQISLDSKSEKKNSATNSLTKEELQVKLDSLRGSIMSEGLFDFFMDQRQKDREYEAELEKIRP